MGVGGHADGQVLQSRWGGRKFIKTTTNRGKKMIMIVGDEHDIGNEHLVGLAHSNIVGMRPCRCIRFSNLSVHGTDHPMSAASVHPRSAANCLIRSAVDISHPRQKGNPPGSSSAVSGPVRNHILNGLGAGSVGGVGNPSLVFSTPPGVFPGSC